MHGPVQAKGSKTALARIGRCELSIVGGKFSMRAMRWSRRTALATFMAATALTVAPQADARKRDVLDPVAREMFVKTLRDEVSPCSGLLYKLHQGSYSWADPALRSRAEKAEYVLTGISVFMETAVDLLPVDVADDFQRGATKAATLDKSGGVAEVERCISTTKALAAMKRYLLVDAIQIGLMTQAEAQAAEDKVAADLAARGLKPDGTKEKK